MSHPIVDEERALLERVSELLAATPFEAPPSETDTVQELVRIRDDIRNAKDEDKPALMQQYEHHFALMSQLRSTRERNNVDPSCPYFAHLRIRDNGRGDGRVHDRDLCLGKATRIDGGLRIVDWRNAPISKVFYSYQQGDEFEETFGERVVEGRILARRTVTIRHGRLDRVDAPEGMFLRNEDGTWSQRTIDRPRLAGGQGAAQTRLHAAGEGGSRRLGTDLAGISQRLDKRLPDIAGLIDPEQFELITRPSTGFLVIRGTAGSGKTTVALHRIAWLAYEDARIDSAETMFLVFSRALRDYVSSVLPALGVTRIAPRTFPEWAAALRKQHFPFLPRKLRDDAPEVVVRLKLHPATMVALERHVEAFDAPHTAEQAMDDWASVLTQPDILLPVLELLAPDAFTPADLKRAMTWCRDRHEELVLWMEKQPGGEGLLDAEDDALLLRAYQLRVGPLQHPEYKRALRYRHIAIDEVQDFSPIEVRVLLDCLDEKKSITLAGDTQQHVMQSAGFVSWSRFFEWLGVQGTAVETLRVAYRSSRQIVEFALAVLGDLREDDAPPMTVREGPPVEVFRFTDHGAVVAFLADTLKALHNDEPMANVAIITPNVSLAEIYAQGLTSAEVPAVKRVIDESFAFKPGVEVVEAPAVKGLEFDYVVLVEVSALYYSDTPSSRRLLHVASTRAIHQLWITSVGTMSPVLLGALAEGSAHQVEG